MQPGLYNVLASSTGPDTTRFGKHGNRSLRQQQPSGQWQHLLTDGLGSVRSVLNANHLPLETIHYTPYGEGSPTASLHGFTGEPTDANGLVHLRARYYDPALGVFPSLDPVEGNPSQPLSLGRYAYVQGNPINAIDPSGLFGEDPSIYDRCYGLNPQGCTGTILFDYNRNKAAQAARRLAAEGSRYTTGLDTDRFYQGDGGTSSARFISIAIAAGGFPMVEPTGDASFPNNQGWYARCRPGLGLQFNSVGQRHFSIAQFLMGSSNVGANFDATNLNRSNYRYTVSAVDLFPNIVPNHYFQGTASGPNYADATGGSINYINNALIQNPWSSIPNATQLQQAMDALRAADIEKGDYILGRFGSAGSNPIDADVSLTASNYNDLHGFLITGTGPAVPCTALDSSIPIGTISQYLSGHIPDVFYVADIWGVQRGTDRPFYCTALNDPLGPSGGYFADQRDPFANPPDPFRRPMLFWDFIKVPNQVNVPCNFVYDPFLGSPNHDIVSGCPNS